jgi:non-ribosomal peptide synthase protein (TIGR01720 family)
MVPLTPIQRWFFGQELERPEHWNQALLLAVSERLEAASLGRAVEALLVQHDALRLRFQREAGEWQQVNLSVAAAARGSKGAGGAPLRVYDLTGQTAAEQRERVEREAARLQKTLNLRAGPLLRVGWFELGAEGEGRLLLVVHHLVVDGVSWRVLLEDLELGYRQAQQGEAIRLGAKTSSYQRWAEQLQRAAGAAEVLGELPYWEEQLGRRGAAAGAVSLPVDHAGGENLERWARVVRRRLSREETRELLQEVPGAYHTQITEVLLTALAGALGEWRGDGQVVVDVEGHGREAVGSGAVEVTRTVGWFTSIYPLRLAAGGSRELGVRLKTVKEQVRGIPQRGVGYGLLRWLSPAAAVRERMAELEEAEVSFNYLGQLDQVLEAGSVLSIAPESVGAMHGSGEQRAYLVEVTASVGGGELQVGWTYSEQVHQRETIERVAERYMEELRQIIAHCLSVDVVHSELSDFSSEELTAGDLENIFQQISEAWSVTQ